MQTITLLFIRFKQPPPHSIQDIIKCMCAMCRISTLHIVGTCPLFIRLPQIHIFKHEVRLWNCSISNDRLYKTRMRKTFNVRCWKTEALGGAILCWARPGDVEWSVVRLGCSLNHKSCSDKSQSWNRTGRGCEWRAFPFAANCLSQVRHN